jgi:hypothetical protein
MQGHTDPPVVADAMAIVIPTCGDHAMHDASLSICNSRLTEEVAPMLEIRDDYQRP